MGWLEYLATGESPLFKEIYPPGNHVMENGFAEVDAGR